LATVLLMNTGSGESSLPLALLQISDARRKVDPRPLPFVLPRHVTSTAIPYTHSQLYDVFRPYGPISSCYVGGCGKGVIQFWREDDAQTAEGNVGEVRINGHEVRLQRFDPRNLFCTVRNTTLVSTKL
jgi:RNA recognition motif-containing protein